MYQKNPNGETQQALMHTKQTKTCCEFVLAEAKRNFITNNVHSTQNNSGHNWYFELSISLMIYDIDCF